MVRIISVASLGVRFSDYGDDQPTDGVTYERSSSESLPTQPKQEQAQKVVKGHSVLKTKSQKKKE